jgi:hypothetical protein
MYDDPGMMDAYDDADDDEERESVDSARLKKTLTDKINEHLPIWLQWFPDSDAIPMVVFLSLDEKEKEKEKECLFVIESVNWMVDELIDMESAIQNIYENSDFKWGRIEPLIRAAIRHCRAITENKPLNLREKVPPYIGYKLRKLVSPKSKNANPCPSFLTKFNKKRKQYQKIT